MWGYMLEYFPLKAVFAGDLDKNKKYIFAIHPHGITSSSTVLNFCYAGSDLYKRFPDLKINLATLDGQFIFPIHRDLILGLGTLDGLQTMPSNLLDSKSLLVLLTARF